MKTIPNLIAQGALVSAFSLQPSAFSQGTAFTYQGQLDHLGAPANGSFDLNFSLWKGPVGLSQVGDTLTNLNVTASNGLVTVTLDFGAGMFTGEDRWLEIAMRTNSGGPLITVVPRQQLTPTPYAITAGNLAGIVPGAGLSGIYSNALTLNNATNSFTGNGAGLTGLDAANLASGTLADARLSANVALLNNPQTFTGQKTFNHPGNSFLGAFTGNGTALTNLNAANLATGTLPDPRLSANVALLNASQTFTADKTFGSGSQLLADSSSASAPGVAFNGDANTGMFNAAADTVALATGGLERMRINSAGDVAIGTSTPEARLHVVDGSAGTVTANASSVAVFERSASGYLSLLTPAASESGILFGSPTNSTDGAIVFNNGNAPRGLQIRTSGNLTRMVILADGRVGIGTLTPDSPLDITTPINTNCSLRLTSGGSWPLILNQSPSSLFTISNGGVARLTITPAGLVGVGRTSTGNDLEVEGTASKTVAGNWLANSDARIKSDVHTLTNALATLARVRLVRFRYTDDYRAAHPGIADHEYLNVVAQEFQKVFPEQVQHSGEKLADGDEILQVDTYPLTIYSAAAVQELNQQVEGLRSELRRRDAVNTELARKNRSLEARLDALEKAVFAQTTK